MESKSKYTDKQIVESIVHWSTYMLENGMTTEEELKGLLNEGLFKRAVAGAKSAIKKTKEAISNVKKATKETLHDIFLPNDGVEKMLVAMSKASKDGIEFDGVKIYANLGGKGKTIPVVGFAMANGKKTLILLVDSTNKSAKPKTLTELRDFLVVDQKIKKVKAEVESIKCAEVPKELSESILLESKLTDYISSKKWSKEDALKPENLKELKKLTKQNDEKTKAAIEKHFASKDEKKEPSKKEAAKTSTTKKPTSKKTATKKPSETKAEPAGEPSKKGKDSEGNNPKTEEVKAGTEEKKDGDAKPDFDGEEEKPDEKKDALKFFDNKLLDVQAKGNAIGFIFSKSKAEISLEKKYTDALEI